eukprot:4366207-Alexandrium_andersonii.AAC.1
MHLHSGATTHPVPPALPGKTEPWLAVRTVSTQRVAEGAWAGKGARHSSKRRQRTRKCELQQL